MTQSSKKNDEYTITLDSGETLSLDSIIDTTGDIVINLNDYNMNTTYVSDSSFTIGTVDTINVSNISGGTYTLDTYDTDWLNNIGVNSTHISPDEIERMCKEYPALEKVWRNFKAVYDMVKQDYKGKKEAGELDDDIPF